MRAIPRSQDAAHQSRRRRCVAASEVPICLFSTAAKAGRGLPLELELRAASCEQRGQRRFMVACGMWQQRAIKRHVPA